MGGCAWPLTPPFTLPAASSGCGVTVRGSDLSGQCCLSVGLSFGAGPPLAHPSQAAGSVPPGAFQIQQEGERVPVAQLSPRGLSGRDTFISHSGSWSPSPLPSESPMAAVHLCSGQSWAAGSSGDLGACRRPRRPACMGVVGEAGVIAAGLRPARPWAGTQLHGAGLQANLSRSSPHPGGRRGTYMPKHLCAQARVCVHPNGGPLA